MSLTVLDCHEQFIHLKVATNSQDWSSMVTFVYGLHTVETRKPLWLKLVSLAQAIGSAPWVLLGDFNAMLTLDDRRV